MQYCWTNQSAGLALNAASEDDKRRICVKCKQFKFEGLLWIDLTGREKITGEDTTMILSTASQAGIIMESFRMYDSLKQMNEKLNVTLEQLKSTHEELKADLQQAHQIQQQLLPTTFPKGLLDIAANYKATMDVGGDYYDCFDLPDDKIGLVVADVSGHGTAAAMMMSMFKIMLKASQYSGVSPALALKSINNTLVTEVDSGKFITVFYAIWNEKTRELTYTSAGHNPMPIMNKETGEIELLRSSGLFLGVMPDITVKDEVLKLDGYYRFALYTDGVNEIMNPEKELFGHKRIYDLLRSMSNESCQKFLDCLSQETEEFRKDAKLTDDLTIMVCDL
jgi:sigma-B regulation protein RsbU (phosphoserine phosphatase)